MPRGSHLLSLRSAVPVMLLLGGAVPAVADDAYEIPLDLQAIPTGDDEGDSWTETTQTRSLRWSITTGVRRETMSGPLGPLVEDINAIGFASLALDADLALAPGLSLEGRAIIYTEGDITDKFVQRVKLEYAPASSPIRVSLGKDYIAWSFTDLAHVLDLSPRESAQIDIEDTGDDYAHPYAMVGFEMGDHQVSLVAMAEGHKFDDIADGDSLFAIRYETQIAQTNLSLQTVHRENNETELSFGVNAPVGAAILSFEASIASRQRLPLASPRAGGGVLEQATPEKNTVQAVLAARLPVSPRWQLETAYLYNGHGYSDSQWETFRSAEDAVLAAMASGNFQYANFLSDAQSAHDSQYLRRNYLSFALSSLEDIGQWSLTAGGTFGLDDGGFFGFATATRPIGKSGRLDVSMSGGAGGFDTEFARRPKEISTQMVWSF